MNKVLKIVSEILQQPAFLMGIITLVGLIALREPKHKILVGTLGPVIGYLMLSAGAGIITQHLDPLAEMIEHGFSISGVVPNNEAITSVAQSVLGVETMSILVTGLLFNLLIARFTKYKYVFLTGHHSFFMASLLSAVLGALGFKGLQLVVIGGFFLGAWSSISPAIGQKYTHGIANGDVAMGHFSSIGYYVSAWIGSKVGKDSKSTEELEIPESLSFLRNTTVSTAITMVLFYLIAAIAAGSDFVMTNLSDGSNPYIYAVLNGLNFAVGVTIVYSGVRMILADLIPAFQGIADKVIPNAIPAVDCAVFFPFAPTAVIIGFLFSFLGGVVGMLILGAVGGVLIIPGLVPHFFTGATAGVYGNSTGGRKGAVVGSFINGLLISFLPALLLPVLGDLGFANTTFGDTDFAAIGIVLGNIGAKYGNFGIYILILITLLVLVLPSFFGTGSNELAINAVNDEDE